jgi:hypothetical protein
MYYSFIYKEPQVCLESSSARVISDSGRHVKCSPSRESVKSALASLYIQAHLFIIVTSVARGNGGARAPICRFPFPLIQLLGIRAPYRVHLFEPPLFYARSSFKLIQNRLRRHSRKLNFLFNNLLEARPMSL